MAFYTLILALTGMCMIHNAVISISETTLFIGNIPWDCDHCFNRSTAFIIEPNDVCLSYVDHIPGPHMIVVVKSSLTNFENRNTLRSTLLTQMDRNNDMHLRYVFLLGQTLDVTLQEKILEESNTYTDIVQYNMMDTYNNLTYKTLASLDYATTRCSSANYVLMLDDDSYANITKLINIEDNVRKKYRSRIHNSLIGACTWRAKSVRDNSSAQMSKFYLSIEEYPHKYFAPYCLGSLSLMSMKVAGAILEVSPNVPFFRFEDVYLGLSLRKTPYSVSCLKYANYGAEEEYNGEENQLKLTCDKLSKLPNLQNVTMKTMRNLWNKCYHRHPLVV